MHLWETFVGMVKGRDHHVDEVAHAAGKIRHDIVNVKARLDVLKMLVERMREVKSSEHDSGNGNGKIF